jgi:hypothetical protein
MRLALGLVFVTHFVTLVTHLSVIAKRMILLLNFTGDSHGVLGGIFGRGWQLTRTQTQISLGIGGYLQHAAFPADRFLWLGQQGLIELLHVSVLSYKLSIFETNCNNAFK